MHCTTFDVVLPVGPLRLVGPPGSPCNQLITREPSDQWSPSLRSASMLPNVSYVRPSLHSS